MMRHALMLARRNLGQTWPNPAVGAVVVKDGQVIGRGWTAKGGRPHAETLALKQANHHAKGATLYVTLEPCAHQGKTPPCTDAIVHAGIRTVHIACQDPNPQVNGKGIAALRNAGLEVIVGECEAEARALNAGFFSVLQRGRPWVSLKVATSLDGKFSNPQERWITGEAARNYGHFLRAEHDAILTGIGTVLADDPLLTCRLVGMEDRSPVRVVIDRQGRLPIDSALVKSSSRVPLWILRPDESKSGEQLPRAMKALAERGITRLLVEAGPTLSSALLSAHLVDEIYWFRAPITIGGEGFSFTPPDGTRYRVQEIQAFGPDTLEIYACSPASSAA